jgi:Rrf2 family protein
MIAAASAIISLTISSAPRSLLVCPTAFPASKLISSKSPLKASVGGKPQNRVIGISRHHLIKVAQHLRSGGYVETARGNGGGLRLAQPAAAINTGRVVRHTENDMHLVTCFALDGQCRIYNGCVLHSVLHEALEAFFAVLDRYYLADLIASRRLLGMPAPAEMA